jgi:hypothetical protein
LLTSLRLSSKQSVGCTYSAVKEVGTYIVGDQKVFSTTAAAVVFTTATPTLLLWQQRTAIVR